MNSATVDLKSLLKSRNLKLKHLADTLKINKSSVTRWAKTKVPGERVVEIETVTGIPRQELRPDLYSEAPKRKRRAAQ